MKRVFDVDAICEHRTDATTVPMRFRLMNDEGVYESYSISAYKPVPTHGCYTSSDSVYVCDSTQIFECRVTIFGLQRTVRLYYEPKSNNSWKLAV